MFFFTFSFVDYNEMLIVIFAFWFTDAGLDLPAHFSPIYFPMGNAATGFFVVFAMIAGVVGVASCISGISHLRYWDIDSLPAAASAATISWSLTALAMGYNNTTISQLPFHFYSKNLTKLFFFPPRFACKEIELHFRNARLVRTKKTFFLFFLISSWISFFHILKWFAENNGSILYHTYCYTIVLYSCNSWCCIKETSLNEYIYIHFGFKKFVCSCDFFFFLFQ